MLAISLMRMGAKKRPFYRVVVKEKRSKRDGKYLENLGTYNPMTEPAEVNLRHDRIEYWIGVGAQPSETVASLIKHNPVQTEEEKATAAQAKAEKAEAEKVARIEAKKAEAAKIEAERREAEEAAKREAEETAKREAAEAEAAKAAEAETGETGETREGGEEASAESDSSETAETTEENPASGE